MARPLARPLALLVVVLTLASCSGSHAAATRPKTTRPEPALTEAERTERAGAGQRYVAIVGPESAAIGRFEAAAAALVPSASVDEFVVLARPLAATITAVEAALRQVQWPAVVLRDIKAELAADESLKADLTGTLDVTLIMDLWRHQVFSAAKKVARTQLTVRMGLGLGA